MVLLLVAGGAGAFMFLQQPERQKTPPSEVLHEAEAPTLQPHPQPTNPPPAEKSEGAATTVVPEAPATIAADTSSHGETTSQGTSTPVVAPPPGASVPEAPAATAEAAKPAALTPGTIFQDCSHCPSMIVVQAGSFTMGSTGGLPAEKPAHKVTITAPFAIGRYEVTFAEWDACAADGGCAYVPGDRGWGRGMRPVIDLSWADAHSYVAWLSKTTGQRYRLPSEAEWEYVGRAGTNTAYWWGDAVGSGHALCADCGAPASRSTNPVGSFPPNAFGLYDTAGNVAEWVEDCWTPTYDGAPSDGQAVQTGQCGQRVLRGGSFVNDSRYLRSASRFKYDSNVRYYVNGFRVARDIDHP